MALLAGCAPAVQAPPPVVATAPPTPPPVQPVPLPQAVANAASAVFSSAPVSPNQRQVVVIDPLVNGVTGEQSVATQQIQEQIIALARSKYPQFDIEPFSAAVVSKGPDVMVGTFTPVNAKGQTAGTREGYRFCLVMVDLRAGKTDRQGRGARSPGRRRCDTDRLLPRQPRLDQRCQRQELYRHVPGHQGRRSDQPDLPQRHPDRLDRQRGDQRLRREPLS